MPQVDVKNFSTDWNDGVILAQFVDAHAPGLCPEYATMDHSQPLENAAYCLTIFNDCSIRISWSYSYLCTSSDCRCFFVNFLCDKYVNSEKIILLF